MTWFQANTKRNCFPWKWISLPPCSLFIVVYLKTFLPAIGDEFGWLFVFIIVYRWTPFSVGTASCSWMLSQCSLVANNVNVVVVSESKVAQYGPVFELLGFSTVLWREWSRGINKCRFSSPFRDRLVIIWRNRWRVIVVSSISSCRRFVCSIQSEYSSLCTHCRNNVWEQGSHHEKSPPSSIRITGVCELQILLFQGEKLLHLPSHPSKHLYPLPACFHREAKYCL